MNLLRPIGALVLALGLIAGCQRSSSRQPSSQPSYGQGYPPYGAPPPQGYPQQPGYPPQQPGYPPQQPGYPPGQTGPAPAPTFNVPTVPGLPVLGDPINDINIGWLQSEAGVVMGALIGALPAAAQQKVRGIPFIADPTVGEVNAFAGCDDQRMPFMAITDGLLEIQAQIAQFKATDEIFGTRKLDEFLQLLAQRQRPGQPILRPPAGFIDPVQHTDARKVERQRQLFHEQLGFVLGHELGHHHLGHTGCANGQGGSRGVSPADLGRLLSRALPVFNQPNEIAADVAGVNNLLSAGARRQGYRWTEGGAMLTLGFFASLDQLTPATILFAFEQTHPHPLLRQPVVQQTANTWRLTGGATGFPFPGLGG
ncbi:M48 family metalloprotease [Sorangium sp. So ce1024]|uniref:M48 family metalloprotease n=1 Tax=unclassified Sorangium TaxID=2621164 RepID=UPI003F02F02E